MMGSSIFGVFVAVCTLLLEVFLFWLNVSKQDSTDYSLSTPQDL
jgi:hypothetical protein